MTDISQTSSLDSPSGSLRSKTAENVPERLLRILKYSIQIVFYLVSRLVPDQEVSIVAYHSVDVNDSFFTVSPDEFTRQMNYLRNNYRIVSLDEIVDFAEGKRSLPKKSVAITFDDGYHDNYLHAYPYLSKHGLPATVFVCTGRVGQRFPLDKILLNSLGWNEIIEMSRNGIVIGVHTVNHMDLCRLGSDQARQEIEEAKTAIEQRIGKKVDYFSYPAGRYNDQVIGLVQSLGFKGAVAGEGQVRRGDHVFVLNRVQVDRSVPFFIFKVRLSRALAWYEKIMKPWRSQRFRAVYDLRS